MPLVGEIESSLFRLVRLSVGVSVTLDHEIKSLLCFKTKFVEGIIQEKAILEFKCLMFILGATVNCEVQMPPPYSTATNLLPSAEQTIATQFVVVSLVGAQLIPASCEQ